ncbi:MAG: MobF family relaxase [Acidimicrobiia bacterium]
MQTIGKLVASQASYYTDQLVHSVGEDRPVLRPAGADQVDYYSGHESPSRWMGTGLERVNLSANGEVDTEIFAQVMSHMTPSGDSMTRLFAGHGRVAAFDHTFSAPKSVSLLFAFGDDQTRQAVVDAHRVAVEEAIGYMEARCSQSRIATKHRDGEGKWRVKTRSVNSEGYLAAAFDHYTSRANDPQVHTHVVVINRVWADGGWRAIDAKRAYAHAKAGGTVYQALLRNELTSNLGVSWKPVVNGMADIDGFSPELIRHFSTRRSEIVEAVDRFIAQHGGEAHPRVWQSFTLETRQPKSYPAGEVAVARRMKDYGITGTVESRWFQKAIDAPEDVIGAVERVVNFGRQGLRPTEEQVVEAATALTEWVTDRQSVFTERDLLAQVASLYPDGGTASELIGTTEALLGVAKATGAVLTIIPTGSGELTLPDGITLTPDEVDLVTTDRSGWIAQGSTVRFRALPGEPRYTTRTQLEREARVLAAVNATSPISADSTTLEASIAARGLVVDQAAAVRSLSHLNGRLVALVGPGGSGKTYAIAAYADAAQAAGSPVIGVATSASAARKLGDDLGDRWNGTIAMLRSHLDTAGRPLQPATMVLVDEASMVSTADLAWLVGKVEECDGKLILIGDPKQLPSVDSGGLFHRIVANGQQVSDELTLVNQRQQLDVDRQNLIRLRRGEISAAVHDYSEAGRLHLGRDEYATKAAMVDAWWEDVQHQGLDQVRMLASRHDEVWMLNQLARVNMIDSGLLNGPALINRWGLQFQAGDRIVVRDNWYSHSDLRNGQTGTVVTIDLQLGVLRFRRDLDGEVIDLPKQYVDRDVDHAYAQTIHTSQGQTFEVTHLYSDAGVKAEHGYTALSRARGETHLWLNDSVGPLGECTHIHGDPLRENRIEELVRQLTQSVIEPLAHDQGLSVPTATDRQLIEWRDELTATIRQSPVAEDFTDEFVAIEAAIDEAHAVAERLRTSGARAQVELIEAQRDAIADRMDMRQAWLEQNAELFHRYALVADEIQYRVYARIALYEIDPPEDLLIGIGPKPADAELAKMWRTSTAEYTEARMVAGDQVDLLNAGVLAGMRWRDVTSRHPDELTTERAPVLKLVG